MRHWDEDRKEWVGLDANKIRAARPDEPETTAEIMIAALIARLETERAAGRREGIRELSPLETQYVTEIRALGEQLKLLTDRMPGDSCDGRATALARTHFQEGLMWAVRAVTKPAFF